MRVVIAPDKFKGCLTAAQVATALACGVQSVRPDAEVLIRPIADGGEGTLDAVISAGFKRVQAWVSGPTGTPVHASFARSGSTAVVEMADASGLARLPRARKAALDASTYGTGELVRAAVAAGCDHIVVGLGGSATTDGGTGMLGALGARFRDESGRPLVAGGGALEHLAQIDLSGMDPTLQGVRFTIASDVAVPLCGPTGAAAMFGPQKGATPANVVTLEAGLMRLADAMHRALGVDHANRSGAGAAGGTGFALLSVLGAVMRPGIDVVLDVVGFDAAVVGAALVITGEGAVDAQTLEGKAPIGVLRRSRNAVPGAEVALVAGRIDVPDEVLRSVGFTQTYALQHRATGRQDSFDRAAELLTDIGADIARGLTNRS